MITYLEWLGVAVLTGVAAIFLFVLGYSMFSSLNDSRKNQ